MALFSVVGINLPKYVARKTPASQYYTAVITNFDKPVYKPCDKVRYVIIRTSEIEGPATFTAQLVHVIDKEKRRTEIINNQTGTGLVDVGIAEVERTVILPCDAPEGNYYIERSVTFKVEGVEKYIIYTSQMFNVKRETVQ